MHKLEKRQNDNNKIYEALKKIKRLKPPQKTVNKRKILPDCQSNRAKKVSCGIYSTQPIRNQHKWQYALLQMKAV